MPPQHVANDPLEAGQSTGSPSASNQPALNHRALPPTGVMVRSVKRPPMDTMTLAFASMDWFWTGQGYTLPHVPNTSNKAGQNRCCSEHL